MHSHCGKVPYSTSASAWRTLGVIGHDLALITHKRIHKNCRVYRCDQCQAWHLTRRLNQKRPEPVDPLRTTKRLNLQRLMQAAAV